VRTKSFNYEAHLMWREGRKGDLTLGGPKPALLVGSPPEFQGDPENISPEDLFLGAIATCQMTTFLAFAERTGLEFSAYEDRCCGRMEIVDGKLVFTEVTLRPQVTVKSDEGRARALQLLEDAHYKCAIANSVRCPVRLEPAVVVK